MASLSKFRKKASWPLMFILALSATGGCATAVQPDFEIKPTKLPKLEFSYQIVHQDRTKSGGFSALWSKADCSEFIFVSDYSQVNEQELKVQPVQRSAWYHTFNRFDQNNRLTALEIKKQGVLKTLDGSSLQGAAESIDEFENGFVVSFDDTGDLWLYSSSTSNSHALNSVPRTLIRQSNFGKGNAGLESIARLEDDRILSVWEKYTADDRHVPISFSYPKTNKTPVVDSLAVTSSPKDLTVLADGSVILLEKDWLGTKGSRLRLSEIDPNNLKVTNLFDHTSVDYDNFEGMTSCVMNNEEWIFIVSDDNGDWPRRHFEDKGIPRQRTLLVGMKVKDLK